MSVITGTSGNNNLNGGSGDDVMDGGAGNDTMSGGSGSDIMDGGSGSDRLNGGSGNDTLNGGSGNDILNGDSGNDTLIYTLGENSGATDVYTGGSGIDTVRLQLTNAEWGRADVQAQIALYLQHLNTVKTNQNTGEVSNGSASDFTFVFNGGTRLTVQMMERLDVWVDGHQFDFHAPFVTAADDAGAVTEDAANPTLSDTGTINFVDVDWTQSHNVTVAADSNALGGMLTAVVSNVATGDGNGVVTWNYGVANSATQHLGVGDTAIETFTVTITDSSGKTDTQTITVTVTGTNDAPVLTVDTSGGVTEDGADPTLSNTGTLSFTDVDVNDGHTVSAAYNGDALWTGGSLTAGQVTAITSGFSADSDSWDYSVANSALQFLGAGETITLSFDVTVTDDSGSGNNADSETVTLTITGSNDAPVVTGAVLATVDEDDSDPATVQLLANASDPDRTDDVDSASVSYAVSAGTWVPAVVYSVDNETGALTFDPNQFNALGVSESIELTFTYNVVDGNGGVTPTTAVVTITGSNDAPVVTGAVLATVDEDDSDPATVQLLANASDPDRTDDVDSASVSYAVSAGTWVPAVVYSVDNETGALTFDPNQFNALGVSESIELTFTYNVVDGNGGVTPTTAVVTITGSNDAPVVTGAVLATVDEDDSDPATVQLLANASDPDRTDDVDSASVSYAVSAGTWVPAVVYSVDNETGALTFDPNQFNALGVSESIELTFTYNVVDGNGGVTPTTAVVTITGSNDAPVVTGAVLATVDEDDSDPATVQLLANASDPDRTDDVDSASVSYAVSAGTWVPAVVYSVDNETGALTFDPNQFNALGVSESIELTFTYNVVDGNGGVTPTTAVVTITGSNDAPVVTGAVLATVDEDDSDPATVQLLANASDPDRTDDVDSASVSYAVSAGTWVPAVVYSVDNETGALTFDPNQFNALGVSESIELTFTYNVVDGNGGVTPTTAVVTITGSNDAPVVTGAVLATVDEDDSDPATVQLLANASDPDRTDDVDSASVSYAVSAGTWVPAVVYSVDNETGALTFDPNQFNALGVSESIELTFTYNVVDGNGGVTPTTAVVTITGSNDAPVVTGAVLATVDEDDSDPATVQLLANASDPDRTDDVDSASVSYAVSAGTWVPAVVYSVDNETGALTFDPNQFNALGVSESIELTFTYNVVDGNGGVTPTTAVVTITGSNDAPVVTGAVLATVDEDDSDPATVQLLANASDPDRTDDVDSASVSYAVSAGTWVPAVVYSVDNETGALTFDPNQFNALGVSESIELTFTYNVVDGNGGVTPTTAVVTITGSNDAPVVTGAVLATVDEDDSDPATVQLLANASDPDRTDDVDSASVSYAVSAGTWVPAVVYSVDNETGALTFDPNQFNALGVSESIELTFSYNVVDGNGGVTPTTAVVTITGSNDAPVVTGAVLATVDEDDSDPATVQLLANASDPDRTDDVDSASVSYAVSAGTWVPAVVYSVDNETGALTFDPNQFNALGVSESIELTFTYNVVDGNGGVTPTTAVVTITGSNDAPVVTGAVLATVDEDDSDPATVQLLANASDPDRTDDVDSASVSYAVSAGTWVPAVVYSVDNETGALTFDPNQFNALGVSESIELTFTYNVVDGNGGVTPTTAVVTITGSNDAPVINAAVTPVLAAVTEDSGAPLGAVGTLVSALVNLNPPAGGLDNVTDADNGASTGIAITGTESSNGTWWFSTNNGGTWTQIAAVSDASALLLAADANTRVYFQPDSNFQGTVSDAITFRAWDQTSGAAGNYVSTAANGGSSAFSSATDTANINVTAVNDNPIVIGDRIIVSNSTLVTIPVSALLGNDTDIDGLALTISSVGSASGITGLTLNANGTISFTSGATAGATAGSFQYTVSDGAGGTATATVTIDIRSVGTGNGGDSIDLSAAGTYQASYLDGRGGADNLTGGAAGDIFIGGTGNGADTLLGGNGNDLLIGGDGNDTLTGGAGNDVLRGGIGNNDSMDGGAGSEDMLDFSVDGSSAVTFTLVQSAAFTNIANGTGGLGNNDMYSNMEGVIGTSLGDNLTGSSSNDIIRGGAGNDTLNGAGGNGDLIDFSDGNAGLTFTLTNNGVGTLFNASAAGLGTDTYSGFEGVIGTAFADTLTGSAGVDQLRGGGGNDVISGSAGDDRIVGAAGADTLTGGADNDTFVFDSAPNAVDSIADFDASETAASDDSIELSLAIFSGLTTSAGSTLSASEFASSDGGGAGDVVGAGIRVIYDSATGNLYYDTDGGSSGNRTLVADITLTNPSDTFDFNDIRVGT